MWKQKLAMAVMGSLGVPVERQLEIFAAEGFEGFSTFYEAEPDIKEYKKKGDELGLEYVYVHAPFHGDARASDMWTEGEAGKRAANALCRVLEECAAAEVPIMVAHTYIGFDYEKPDEKTAAIGLENFGKVAKRAGELGVKLALENTEGEEFLEILMRGLSGEKSVGFCFDSGHEQCYNRGRDMLALYGDRLIVTHLDDNLGIRRLDGRTQPRDDLHLLPFDGIIDWTALAGRLDAVGYRGTMTLELKNRSHSDRHTNALYEAMPPEVYVAQAYNRACRIAALRKIKQE